MPEYAWVRVRHTRILSSRICSTCTDRFAFYLVRVCTYQACMCLLPRLKAFHVRFSYISRFATGFHLFEKFIMQLASLLTWQIVLVKRNINFTRVNEWIIINTTHGARTFLMMCYSLSLLSLDLSAMFRTLRFIVITWNINISRNLRYVVIVKNDL